MVSPNGRWVGLVVSSDNEVARTMSQMLFELGLDVSWLSNLDQCRHVMRRDLIDIVFCDTDLEDGGYWDVYDAITTGLIRKPKLILLSPTVSTEECQQAKQCGFFAVLDSPPRRAAVELVVALVRSGAERARPPKRVGVPKFDIFAGTPDRDATWICAVEGLANARERMEALALEKPGRYFVFFAPDRTVLAQTETFTEAFSKSKARKESA